MTPAKRKKNKLLSFLSGTGSKKKRRNLQDILLNGSIAILSLILIAFIISFTGRYTRGGLEIDTASLDQVSEPMLATEYYEMNPILDIEVEILNGCGEAGLAATISDFLRQNQIDVVRSENADHFNYATTLLIQRNEKVDNFRKVANALAIDITDETRVMVLPEADLDVDVTLIVGKDYKTIKPVADFLKSRF